MMISVFTFVPFSANAETSGEYEYSVLADGSVMITGYNGSESELVVPETIDSKKVTIIGDRAFRENTNIVNVTLPFGVVEIGKSTFWDCKNMHSITIPSSVNRMNYSALGEMMGEEDGTYIRGFVINGYSGSEAEAYSQNGDLDITFNNLSETKTSAEGIYDYVILEDDSAIITQYNGEDEEIVVPDKIDGHKIVRIGNKAFSSNPRDDREKYLRLKKLKKVTLPNSLISIGKSAFYNCSNLVEISVPDSVKYISDSAFSGCDSLSKLDLPKGLIYLGEYALFGTAIETLNLGNMLDEISRALCWDCTALKTVSISDSITSIGNNAFDSCENLKSLDIPKSVSYISPGAFYNCSALESINIAEGNENYSSINGVLFNKEKTELLLYPSGSKESTFNVPDGIERLESSIFYRNFNLKVINLPASVSRIEDNVFTGCFALTDINVDNDNQMYSSKDGVLFNKNRSTLMRYPINKSLSEYVLPDEVSNLPARCFSNSKNLTNVVLPKGLISIGAETFVNCSGLKSITIPSNTKRIEYWALGWYSEGEDEDKYKDFVITGYSGTAAETYAEENGFEFISLGEAPTEPKSDFEYEVKSDSTAVITRYNGSDKDVAIPESIDGYTVNTIESYAFKDCESLETLTIPKSVTEIAQYEFWTCKNLKSITVEPDNPNYSSLEGNLYNKDKTILIRYSPAIQDDSFTVPESVLKIDDFAFCYSENLTKLIFDNNLTYIGDSALTNCPNIKELHITKNVKSISWYALGNYEKISVDSENQYFSSPDGNLYNKNMTTFYRYATLKTDTDFVIPESVTAMWITALQGSKNLRNLTVPEKVSLESSFVGYVIENYETKKIDGFKIYGYCGSPAEQYAKDNEFEFIEIKKTQPTTEVSNPTEPTEAETSEPTTEVTLPTTTEPNETQPTTNSPTSSTEPTETQPVTDESTEPVPTIDISNWNLVGLKDKEYNGKPQTQKLAVTNGKDYATVEVTYKNNVEIGTATVIIRGTGKFEGLIVKTFEINRAKNPIVVKAKTKSVKAKALQSKKQTVKAITITKAKGSVKVTIVKSGTTKKIRTKITVSKKGIITLKKGKYTKGSYKIKVKIVAKGNSKFKSKTLNRTLKIIIK